jgi:hypothetical protein
MKSERPVEYAERVLNRIGAFIPGFWKKIDTGRKLTERNIFFSDQGVANVHDTNLLYNFDRKNCVVATVAAQNPQSNSIFIDKRLFYHSKHAPQSRGVMYLHEWVYNQTMKQGATDSSSARMIVAKMLDNNRVNPTTELIDIAIGTGLISKDVESYDGIQLGRYRAWQKLEKDFNLEADHGWLIGECRGDCERDWNGLVETKEKILKNEKLKSCSNMVSCLQTIEFFLPNSTGKEKEALEGLQSTIKYFLQEYVVREKLLKNKELYAEMDIRSNSSDCFNCPIHPSDYTVDSAQFTFGVSLSFAVGELTWIMKEEFPLAYITIQAEFQARFEKIRKQEIEKIRTWAKKDIEEQPHTLFLPSID